MPELPGTSREQLGLLREVVHSERITGEPFHIVALKCGHWRKSHTHVEPGTFWGCLACDALEKLTAAAPWNKGWTDRGWNGKSNS